MEVGRLDKSVVIQQNTIAADEFGSKQTDSWSTYATVWAQIIWPGVSKTETIENSQKVSVSSPIIRVRYDSGINETMRVQYDSQNYYIKGISEIGRNKGLDLYTERRDNE